jgi:tRNA dimethylallyltransferase
MSRTPVIGIVGPTATGKSALAVEVARALRAQGRPAEIVNADSMLVYRGMDIGTAKPDAAILEEIPHHLIDILDVRDTASVAEFQTLARDTIEKVRSRDAVPIVVGGSSLYIRAVFDDLDFPGTDPAVRERWERELEKVGPQALHAVLAEKDPQAAAGILPGNGRRIVRALEVVELTGHFKSQLPEQTYAIDGVQQFGLRTEREELDRRIAIRTHQMWHAGWQEECRTLAAAGLRDALTASKALGYAQVLAYLDGELTSEEAITAIIDQTKRFARKQLGWFKRDKRITWLDADAPDNAAQIVAAVLEY